MTKKSAITDKELDEIYDAVDLLMTAEAWISLEHIFAALIPVVAKIDLDILLTYATASLPGKSKLPMRAIFIDKCRSVHPDPTLWIGLI